MAVRINTTEYEWTHGRKPRTVQGQPALWAFRADSQSEVLWIHGTYSEAVQQAKQQAQYSVTVLP